MKTIALGTQPVEVLMIIGTLAVLAGFVALIVWLLIKAARKYQREYEGRLQTFANEMGLTFHAKEGPWYSSTPANVTGSFRGREVKLDQFTVSHGKSSTTYMRLEVRTVDSGESSVSVSTENFLTKIGKMVGMADIQVDQQWFDDKYLVRGSSPDFARQVLSEDDTREKISAVIDKSKGELIIEDHTARWKAIGFHHQPQLLAVTLDALCDMADAADGGGGGEGA
jgi:hypothetical protein